MVIQITLCVLLILGFAWLLWMLGCALLTPVRSGRDTRITLVVQARGDAPELENLLRGALWLRESGTAAADILLVDCGLTEEGRRAASLAVSDTVTLVTPSELPNLFTQETRKG